MIIFSASVNQFNPNGVVAIVGMVVCFICAWITMLVWHRVNRPYPEDRDHPPVYPAITREQIGLSGVDPETDVNGPISTGVPSQPKVVDPNNPPRFSVYRPRVYREGAMRCTCHQDPIIPGEKILLWPIPNHPDGGMDVYCARTYQAMEQP